MRRLQQTEKELAFSEKDRRHLLQQLQQVPGLGSKRGKPPKHSDSSVKDGGDDDESKSKLWPRDENHAHDEDGPASSSPPKVQDGKINAGIQDAEKGLIVSSQQAPHSNGGSQTARSGVQDINVHDYVPLTALVRVPGGGGEGGTDHVVVHFPHELDDADYIRL